MQNFILYEIRLVPTFLQFVGSEISNVGTSREVFNITMYLYICKYTNLLEVSRPLDSCETSPRISIG